VLELFKIVGKIALEGQEAVNRALTDVTQNATSTDQGMIRLGDSMQRLGTKVSATGGKMTKWVTGPMAAVGTAVGLLANKAASYTKDLDRMVQISNTSSTQFQRQAFAVKSVGIESDKYADILKDVNDGVGDFMATGGGPMADFFENIAPKVGVTAAQFKNLSGPDALQLYVSSLEKANVSQADMTFYMEALAGDSAALWPLLRNNGKGMKMLGDEAENAGLILSEEMLASTREARGDMAKFGQVIDIVAVQIGAALIPILTALVPVLIDVVVPAAKAVADVITTLVEMFTALPEPVQTFITTAIGITAALGPVLVVVGKVIAIIGGLTKAFVAVKLVVLAFAPALGPILVAAAPVILIVAAVAAGIYLLVTAVQAIIEHLGGWDEAWRKTKELMASLWESIKQLWADGSQFLQEKILQIIGWFQEMPAMVVTAVKGMVTAVLDWFSNMANMAVQAVKNMFMNVVNYVKNMAQNVVDSIKSMYNAVVGNSIVPDMVNGVLDEFNNMTDGAVRDTQNLVKGVNSELAGLPSQVNPEVNMNGAGGGRAAGSGGGQTVVDMRHAVIRDDKDMLDRMRRSGLDMTGAF